MGAQVTRYPCGWLEIRHVDSGGTTPREAQGMLSLNNHVGQDSEVVEPVGEEPLVVPLRAPVVEPSEAVARIARALRQRALWRTCG